MGLCGPFGLRARRIARGNIVLVAIGVHGVRVHRSQVDVPRSFRISSRLPVAVFPPRRNWTVWIAFVHVGRHRRCEAHCSA